MNYAYVDRTIDFILVNSDEMKFKQLDSYAAKNSYG